MRCVLDTNVLLSGLLWQGTPKKCLDAFRLSNIYQLILSPELVDELRVKLSKKFKVPDDLIHKWEREISQYTYLVVPKYVTGICRDPNDNKVLDTASEGDADYIVT